ncbi:hypothetical protein ACK3ZC_17360 [Aeromonas caviae]
MSAILENMKKLNFGFTGDSDSLTKLSTSLGQWWYIFAAGLGSAIVSIASSFVSSYSTSSNFSGISGLISFITFLLACPFTWLLIGAALIIYGGKGTYNDQFNLNNENKRLSKENNEVTLLNEKINSISEDSTLLQNELSELQVKLVTTWLKGCSRQLNLNTNCRTTIYYYVEQHFYVLARHSQNPKLEEIHTQKFSRNHGVISKAWEHKSCIDIEDIPVYSEKPDEYIEYMVKQYGYSEERTKKLTMKSCQYIAFSIVEADKHIGVIVFESDRAKNWNSQKVTQIKKYCEEYQGYLVDFIRGGIKYDRTVQLPVQSQKDVDNEFITQFKEGKV